MLKFLPDTLLKEINTLNSSILEVRIRKNYKVKVTVKEESGEITTLKLSSILSEKDIENIVLRLCNYSVFSVENSLKEGFITSSEGERVGICGEVAYYDGGTTIKNITSLCVRFPREVRGIAEEFFNAYAYKEPKSCLVISPPFQGKTTFIRDLGRLYSDKLSKNVLYLDERDELYANGRFYLGENADVMRFSTKEFGFKQGVRALNPDVIVCDELMSKSDCEAVLFASQSGVKVVSSVHSDNMKNLLKKQEISEIIKSFTFDYHIVLSRFKVSKIFKGNTEEIC